jgi:hypothetical protein
MYDKLRNILSGYAVNAREVARTFEGDESRMYDKSREHLERYGSLWNVQLGVVC